MTNHKSSEAGPSEWIFDAETKEVYCVEDGYERVIASVGYAPEGQIIAAAPKMLTALRVLLAWTEGAHEGMGMRITQTPLEQARVVIAKATAE